MVKPNMSKSFDFVFFFISSILYFNFINISFNRKEVSFLANKTLKKGMVTTDNLYFSHRSLKTCIRFKIIGFLCHFLFLC